MKKLLGVFLALLGLCLFSSSASASALECDYSKIYDDPATLYVSRDGTGDFQCDGSNDEVEINAAFQAVKDSNGAYTSVFLKSGTYVVGSPVHMVGSSVLEGDQDAVLKLKDQAAWTVNVPMIGTSDTGASNLEIKCFQADMNYDGNFSADAYSCMAGKLSCAKDDYSCCEAYSAYRTTGKGYYNVAGFTYGSDYSMHDMYLHDGLGDGLNIVHGSNIKFYDNTVYKMGHEGLYVKYSDTAEAYGNTITNRANSGLRADDTNHVSYHDNDIQAFDNWSAGGPGIEIVKDNRSANVMNDVQIFNNVIHGTYGPGIWITASGTYGAADTAASIHHNIFYETGINPSINWTAGILTSGFYNLTIENNVFDQVYNGALIVSNAVNTLPSASGYVTNFRNNIITGTQPQRNTTTNGYGIINSLPNTHTVNSGNNIFFDNYAGDYSGAVAAVADLETDPFFADAAHHDYHLKSVAGRWDGAHRVQDEVSSPGIDAGSAASDYALEPYYNGGRINIGRYGNTVEASLSPVVASTYALVVNGGSGSGSYVSGQAVTITAAAPASGQVFDKWTGDTAYVSDATAPTATVTMPAAAITFTASYKDQTYALTVSGGSGSGSYNAGEDVTVVAAAVAGKVFDKWTGDTAYVSNISAATASVTMPASAVALTATYKTAYYLTVNYGSGDGYFASAAHPTITANAPAAGKVFSKWTGYTSYVSSIYASTATVTMPSKNISLTATYKSAPTHYLTITNGSGDGYYYLGKVVTIKANTPATGKVFSKWTGDTSYVSSIYASTATVTMPNLKISLTATYKSR